MIFNTTFSVSYPQQKIQASVSASVRDGQITRLDIKPAVGSKPIAAWVKTDIRNQVLRDFQRHADLETGQAN